MEDRKADRTDTTNGRGGGSVVAVNVGRPRTVQLEGRTITTAIWKTPVEGTVAIKGVNVAGDDQADRENHGGVDKAVYAYANEDTQWWEHELGVALGPGAFGENLTLSGIDVTNALVGERWRVGTAVLEVSQPRIPCFKLGLRMGDPRFPKRFGAAGRPGAYLRIVREGEVAAGDGVQVLGRPKHELTVGIASHTYLHDRGQAAQMLEVPQLADGWKQWARHQVERGLASKS